MGTGHPPWRIMIVGMLSVAAGACANSRSGGAGTGGSASPVGNTGGVVVGGGSGGSGGSSKTIGPGGSASGGTVGKGGAPASGGTTGAAGQVGGTPGGGGQTAGGAQTATGGQAGRGTGGGGQTGGTTAAGGQAGRGTGGSAQTGGTTAAGGQPGTGGQAGRGTGGSAQTGGTTATGGQACTSSQRSISFGTLLDGQCVMTAAQQLAKSLANSSSSQWQAKGDQHRTYHFAEANTDEPYRIYVPTNWDGKSSLPLAMFLHGSGSDENTYLDQNNKQMVNLAQQHGYLLVSPLGDKGAYGNFLRLTSPFGDEADAADLMAQVTPDSELTNELSEKDVINVIELVLNEYPVDRTSMFLFGHSMGSGGTWYIGGKYPDYWNGLAPMSGPFVQESGHEDHRRNTSPV
jgi:predicted esterase